MNITEIIGYTRSEILDDTVQPYLWSTEMLIRHFTRSYEELAREAKCLIDMSTASACNVNLLANQSLHAFSPKVVEVYGAWRNSDGYQLVKRTENFMMQYPNWRASTGTPMWLIIDSMTRNFSVYPKFNTTGYIAGDSDISFVASGKHILQTGGEFTSHYDTGDTIVISGTTNNNGTFTVVTVADADMTVAETLTGETPTSAIIQKVRDMAVLRVARLPLVEYVANDIELSTPPTPELDAQYHYGLCNGIAKYAYSKPDSETYDPQAGAKHTLLFEQFKSDVTLHMANLLLDSYSQCNPHYGTI